MSGRMLFFSSLSIRLGHNPKYTWLLPPKKFILCNYNFVPETVYYMYCIFTKFGQCCLKVKCSHFSPKILKKRIDSLILYILSNCGSNHDTLYAYGYQYEHQVYYRNGIFSLIEVVSGYAPNTLINSRSYKWLHIDLFLTWFYLCTLFWNVLKVSIRCSNNYRQILYAQDLFTLFFHFLFDGDMTFCGVLEIV